MTNYKAYEASAATGAHVIETDIGRIRAACGNRVRFVIAGYSQGAWSVHKALYALAKANDGSLGLISAVVLFGDPEFQPRLVIDRGSQKGLANSGLATPIDTAARNVPGCTSRQDRRLLPAPGPDLPGRQPRERPVGGRRVPFLLPCGGQMGAG